MVLNLVAAYILLECFPYRDRLFRKETSELNFTLKKNHHSECFLALRRSVYYMCPIKNCVLKLWFEQILQFLLRDISVFSQFSISYIDFSRIVLVFVEICARTQLVFGASSSPFTVNSYCIDVQR